MLIFNSKAVVERRGFRPKFSMKKAKTALNRSLYCLPYYMTYNKLEPIERKRYLMSQKVRYIANLQL